MNRRRKIIGAFRQFPQYVFSTRVLRIDFEFLLKLLFRLFNNLGGRLGSGNQRVLRAPRRLAREPDKKKALLASSPEN